MTRVLDNSLDVRGFHRELTNTITWCSRNVSLENPEKSLRTISPRDKPYLVNPQYHVLFVARQRYTRLYEIGLKNLEPVEDLQGGRLLVYRPNWTDSSGASKFETQGFLDAYDCPPFDTWISYVVKDEDERMPISFREGYLVSWVPSEFIESVDRGIEVCPTSCIGWLDWFEYSLTQSLEQLNLLS